jgi:NTP pyrophosphatase (non-canonical NTP hydrolase)
MTPSIQEFIDAGGEIEEQEVLPPLPMDQYLVASSRTVSDSFHGQLMSPGALRTALEYRLGSKNYIDGAKKTLFYGRTPNGAVTHLENTSGALEPGTHTLNIDQLHAILGVDSEAAELIELLYKQELSGEPIDRDELINEAGDVLWYLALLFRLLGVTFEEVAALNIRKLQLRYPDKFTAERANIR